MLNNQMVSLVVSVESIGLRLGSCDFLPADDAQALHIWKRLGELEMGNTY